MRADPICDPVAIRLNVPFRRKHYDRKCLAVAVKAEIRSPDKGLYDSRNDYRPLQIFRRVRRQSWGSEITISRNERSSGNSYLNDDNELLSNRHHAVSLSESWSRIRLAG